MKRGSPKPLLANSAHRGYRIPCFHWAATSSQEVAWNSKSWPEALPSQKLACQVREFDFSAHAPRELLFDYIRKLLPRVVILVHGDPPAVSWCQAKIAQEMPGTRVVIPEPGKEYEF